MSPVRTPVALVPTQLGTALQWFRDPPHQVVSLAKAFVDHSSLSIERPTTIRDPARFEIRTFLTLSGFPLRTTARLTISKNPSPLFD